MADEKITDMPENTTPAGSDLMELVDDPAGTPDNQKITLDTLFGYLKFVVDAADNLALRNGTTAQTFRIYNTFTDASNYERAFFRWSSNILEIGPEAAGTGSQREWRLGYSNRQISSGTVAGANAVTVNANYLSARDIALDQTETGSLREIWITTNGVARIQAVSGFQIDWSSSATIGAIAGDTRLERAQAGVLQITDTSDGGGIALPDAGELTIATGAVTATGTYHTIDTESDAASDDLDTINGGTDGMILVIQAENGARTVVAKDGTGNLQLSGDFSLDNTQDTLTLMFSSALSAWVELSRSDNGA